MRKRLLVMMMVLAALAWVAAGCSQAEKGEAGETKLLYQGHASFRITSKNGTVIYLDPAEGEGYGEPADIILVTHDHNDHNAASLVKERKEDCKVIKTKDVLENGEYKTVNIGGVEIEGVKAENGNHDPRFCVGSSSL